MATPNVNKFSKTPPKDVDQDQLDAQQDDLINSDTEDNDAMPNKHDDYNDFPRWLKRHGLTVYRFSKLSGVPRATAQRWANGWRMPNIGKYGLMELERRIAVAKVKQQQAKAKYVEFGGDDPDDPWEFFDID